MAEDAQAAEKVALTDAEGDAWDALGEDTDIVCCCDGCNFYSPSYDESRECSIQTHVKAIVAARVAEAVDRERAAWATKVEVLLLDWRGLPVWGPNTQGLMILDDVDSESLMADLRALLAADDTEAQA